MTIHHRLLIMAEEIKDKDRMMKQRIFWIARAGLLLALLIALQWVTKPLTQLVTGSAVNGILAVAVLFGGLSCGLTVALISPICAFLLNIAPNLATVPAIMAGNAVFVIVLHVLCKGGWVRRIIGLLAAAVAKFAVLYGLVNWVICGIAAQSLLSQGILKAPMLKLPPTTFGLMQMVTALIGGTLALMILPVLKKALRQSR